MSGLDPNAGGALVVPGGGGGAHTSGTLAARPASPAAGDTYEVTSGAAKAVLIDWLVAFCSDISPPTE